MALLETRLALEEIKQLWAKYWRCRDTNEWRAGEA